MVMPLDVSQAMDHLPTRSSANELSEKATNNTLANINIFNKILFFARLRVGILSIFYSEYSDPVHFKRRLGPQKRSL